MNFKFTPSYIESLAWEDGSSTPTKPDVLDMYSMLGAVNWILIDSYCASDDLSSQLPSKPLLYCLLARKYFNHIKRIRHIASVKI